MSAMVEWVYIICIILRAMKVLSLLIHVGFRILDQRATLCSMYAFQREWVSSLIQFQITPSFLAQLANIMSMSSNSAFFAGDQHYDQSENLETNGNLALSAQSSTPKSTQLQTFFKTFFQIINFLIVALNILLNKNKKHSFKKDMVWTRITVLSVELIYSSFKSLTKERLIFSNIFRWKIDWWRFKII